MSRFGRPFGFTDHTQEILILYALFVLLLVFCFWFGYSMYATLYDWQKRVRVRLKEQQGQKLLIRQERDRRIEKRLSSLQAKEIVPGHVTSSEVTTANLFSIKVLSQV